jgi:type IV secretion system protein VirD4
MNIKMKKLLILNIPYLFIALAFTKLSQAWRYSTGYEAAEKILHLSDGFAVAFNSPLPSFHPQDLIFGILLAAAIRLAVYLKGRNAKKYRKGVEYGSARWGKAEDIRPFTDPVFQNNVILTQTESLMMSSRPKNPKNARNKNVLIVGGSGSGKTRFWLKPNLMQCHSSYVVTDPKRAIFKDNICEVLMR